MAVDATQNQTASPYIHMTNAATETTFHKTPAGFEYERDGNNHGPFASHVEASEHCFHTYTAKHPRAVSFYPELKTK